MKKKITWLLLAGLIIVVFNGCKRDENFNPPCNTFSKDNETGKFNASVPSKWYALAIRLSRSVPNQNIGPIISRTFGYMGLALYESVVPGMSGYQSIQQQLNGLPTLPQVDCPKKYYYPACANAALALMVHRMFGNTSATQNLTIDSLETALSNTFITETEKPVLERSVSFGKAVSDAIYNWSVTDGGDQAYLNPAQSGYTLSTGPGLFVPLTGQVPQLPLWGNNRTFVKGNASNTQPAPPPAYSLDPASAFYKDELEVYNESINQNPEHRAIALYWAALPPPCVSLSILSSVLDIKKSNLATAAEAYCKVGIATADAMVSCYKTKYIYNQLRPITFIRANFNPVWASLIPTPPFPDYTSAHSVQTGACVRVLADIFGDNTSFTDNSINDLGFAPRNFSRFSDYATEVGLSRIYGGIHLRSSDFVGLDQGNLIGKNVGALHFQAYGN